MLQTIGHTITNQGNALHRQSEVAKWSDCTDNWGNSPTIKGCAQLVIYWALFGKEELQITEFSRTPKLTIWAQNVSFLKCIHCEWISYIKYITNSFAFLSRVYKYDSILVVLLIKQTNISFAKERWPRNYYLGSPPHSCNISLYAA